MKKHIWLLFIVGIFFGFALSKKIDSISRKEIRAAQNLFNLDFSKSEIDTMIGYLERNRKGYDSMRTYHLENDVSPAVTFDPYPMDLIIRPSNGFHDWDIDESIKLPENRAELAFLSIQELAGLIKSKKLTSLELTEIYLQRIKKYDAQLLAFVTVTEELAIKQAKIADQEISNGLYRGPLHGIPYGVKDLASVPGYPTTWGSEPYKNQVIDQTATVVQKLEDAGAVLLGKLVSGSLARGDVWFGGKTKNPWDLEQGATGSSAGSGSATSAGLVAFSIGTETLGSIVSPSTRCGVTGLRPTFGAVSRTGIMTLSWSMDKVGPICRSASDCAIVYDFIKGQDKIDRSVQDASFGYENKTTIQNLKIGYLASSFDSDSTGNNIHNQRTLSEFKALGIEPVAVKLPENHPFAIFDIILRAESGAFFDELVLTGKHSEMVEQHKGSRANSLRQSRFIPAVEYLQANRHRRLLINETHQILKEYDVVICPTFGGRQMLITNLTGHPALSLPNGFDSKGRPTSITLISNFFEEAKLIALAEAFQNRQSYHSNIPKGFDQ
ncbi:amidase [Aquiflexum lacus]|uniref:amidase n=1 Tax=Aquiflexum lacus TaxID=2483805 RepID=UPI001893C4B5|nr:amidase [Aquiflexum lacus]